MKLTARPELSPSSLAALGFFVLIGLVANVIQVTQSVTAGEFSVLTISVGVVAVAFVVLLARKWVKSRQAARNEVGTPDRLEAMVAVCLVLMTLSALTVAVSTVAIAMTKQPPLVPGQVHVATAPDNDSTDVGRSIVEPTSKEAPSPTTGRKGGGAITFGNGTHVVGVDIKPGSYRTDGAGPTGTCIWQRLKDTSGEISSVITSGFVQGPTTVTVKETDGAFESQYCQNWTKVN